jgi:hypothetical protein
VSWSGLDWGILGPALITVGGRDAAKDLFGLFNDTVARLLAAGAKP